MEILKIPNLAYTRSSKKNNKEILRFWGIYSNIPVALFCVLKHRGYKTQTLFRTRHQYFV